MRQLGHEEKAALLLTAADDDEDEGGNDHHEMTGSPPPTTTDRFPVLRKRPRTYRRYETSASHPVLCFAVILGAFVFGCVSGVVIMLYRFSQDATNAPAAGNAQQLSTSVDLSIQTKLFESIAKGNFANVNRSTESDADAANRLYQQWQSLSPSLSQVKNFSYDASLSRYAPPSQWSGVQLLDGKSENELLKIDRLATEDLVSFASLIKSDTVDANAMFYVNYGRPEDFAYLIQNRIQFTAPNKSIAFMRRQTAVLSQTEQIHQAIYYGFSALVLFDDHENQRVNTTENRQSLFREFTRPTKEADTVSFLNGGMKTKVHPIAVLVLSYEDVQRIFGSLQPDSNQWSTCPSQWHDGGTLMKIGGTLTSIKLRLTVQTQVAKVQFPVVISSIRGSVDPDRFVMLGFRLGCTQQTRIVNELIQAFVDQVKTGWSPRRSIVFCAWSGTDYDQYAANRWISENSRFIDRNLITYLDLGVGIVGNFTLNLRGSALLQQVASRAADYVPSPLPHNHTCHNRAPTASSSSLMTTTTTAGGMAMSHEGGHHHDDGRKRRSTEHENHMQTETKCEPHKLFDEWLRVNRNRSVEIVQIVDTDSAAALFQLRYGIPSMLIEMNDEQAVNTNAFYVRHIPTVTRPTIEPKVLAAYTQFVSELLRQLADEPLLAFNLSNYADRLDKLLPEYQKEFQHSYQSLEWHIGSFSAFANTVTDLTKSIRQVQSRIDRISKNDFVALQAMNRQMIEFERLFIGPDALRWMNSPDKIYKHVLFGPAFGLSSTAVPFPSLSNILAGVPGDPPEEVCNTAKLLAARLSEHFAVIRRTLNGFDGLLGSDSSR